MTNDRHDFVAICLIWGLVVLAAAPAKSYATTYEVPGDAATIQEAVNLAANGDRVILVDAYYSGAGNYLVSIINKTVSISSQSGVPENCVIDAAGQPGFVFLQGSWGSSLSGLTVTNGHANQGGAVFLRNSGDTFITNCIFSGNSAVVSGGAIYSLDTMTIMEGCVFRDNSAASGGAFSCGRMSSSLSPRFRNCVFLSNEADFAGGIEARNVSQLLIEYCTFFGNVAHDSGGAIGSEGTPFQLTFSTLIGNSSGAAGGAGIAGSFPAGTRVENSMIVNSASGVAVEIHDDNSIVFSCCNIFGNAGGDWIGDIAGHLALLGNLSADPLFCSSTPGIDGYWGLRADSPCSPDQSTCGQIGAWGADCGSTPTRTLQWGSAKALFR